MTWNHLTTLGNKQFPNSTEEPLEISSFVHWRLRGIISFSLRKTQTVSSRHSQKSYIFFKAEKKKDGILDHTSICNFAFLKDDAELSALNSHNSAEEEIDKWEKWRVPEEEMQPLNTQKSISSAEDLQPVELQETSNMEIPVLPDKIFILYFYLG